MESVTEAGTSLESTRASWAAGKLPIFIGIVGGVLVLDYFTKAFVSHHYYLFQVVNLIGDYVRITYIHNPGAAFGINIGDYSRVIFLLLSIVALIALLAMYHYTSAADRMRLAAIALICGGALGNLIDRVRSDAGVVDFLDIGVGHLRWPVFNVADMAVTVGAIILALSLWKEEQRGGTRP